ncbi:MAG TPA: protein kinase [Candidatus Acidoferrum sp.]|nr:protein kinase [Candidatus Acidoferrum sp.]
MALQTKHFYAFGPFRLDSEKRVLVRDGTAVPLAPKASEILLVLVEQAGHLVDKDALINRVWPDAFVEEGNLNKNIFFLRKALGEWEPGREYIETVPKRGYRFVAPVSDVTHAESAPRQRSATATNLIGKKVSHYRVLEILGGGGMGVVYRAEDIKLGRRVALKFLPEESAKDPAALGRFEREARSASALEHPNICPIYEFGEHEGQPFLVMQLLEGQTLRELISGASPGNPPLAINKLLDLAIQIAAGLDAAHRLGIIHRDIKPANIFVTNDGQAKILDFGLAKLARLISGTEDDSDQGSLGDGAKEASRESGPAATPDAFLSLTGVAMGTAGYMSPEQVRGEKLDARTDLFSFGLVLYEMATGKRAFAGDTRPELQQAILTKLPRPAREVNPALPAKLEKIIGRALEKDRETRYQSASEMRTDLEALKREIEPKHRARRWEMAAAVVILLFIAGAAFWFAKHQSAAKNPPVEVRLRQLTSNSIENAMRGGGISPDGKYLAYIDRLGMHIKLIESGETRTIPQPDELKGKWVDWEIGPWFPDGTRFLANTHPPGGDGSNWTSEGTSIWIVSLLGGPPRKLRDAAYADAISPDGSTIAFNANPDKLGDREIWLMGSDGSQAHKLYEAGENGVFGGLYWSPDGQRILYDQVDKVDQRLFTRDLKGGTPVAILSAAQAKRLNDFLWLPDGRIIYALWETVPEEGTCNYWQIRIDPRSGKPVEESRRITNWAGFCVGGTNATADSKRLAFLEWRAHTNVYVADLQSNGTSITTPTRLTLDEGWNEPLGWAPDGKAVLFFSRRNGQTEIFRQALGQDTAELVVTAKEGERVFGHACVSPEGSWVLYTVRPNRRDPQAPAAVMRASITGGSPQIVLSGDINGGQRCAQSPATLCAIAERSADGKQLVFTAFDPLKGRGHELAEFKTEAAGEYRWDLSRDGAHIAILKKLEERLQILSLNGSAPQEITVKGWNFLTNAAWTPDGKGLLVSSFNERGSVLLNVDMSGNARILWEQPGGINTYALPSPDGRHLAMLSWTNNTNMWMMENF